MSRYRLATFAFLLSALTAAAQVDRRSRDEPEMFIDAGGRSGTCDALLFSPDGKYLYAGGDDKVVRVWPVGGRGLETGRMSTLRWPAWREQRGGVKTLAVPPKANDRRVFIAGYGLKEALGVVVDEEGEILGTNDIEGLELPGSNVMASAFVPDGKSVIYGTAEGQLWQWNISGTNRPLEAHEPQKDASGHPDFNRPRMIRFLNDGSFVSVSQTGEVLKGTPAGDNWTFTRLFTVSQSFAAGFRAAGETAPTGRFQVHRADLSPDEKWLACAFQPNYLVICPMNGGAARAIKVDFAVRSLAFDSKGRLAVAVTADNTQSDFRVEANDTIRLYEDPTTAKPEPTSLIKFKGRAEAMSWGPNGLLAIAGGDNHEVTLYDLKSPVKEATPLQVVRGKGRGIWEVRVGKDGETIQFKPARNSDSTDPNRRGRGDLLAFNFATGQPVEAKEPVEILTEAGGWKIEPSKKDPMVWFAVRADGTRSQLMIDRNRDEQPRCFCFLPQRPGKPTRVLVGHYYGFSIFDLDGQPQCYRTGLATGHAGDVMSIAASADGTWCVTAGMDQTVAVWSLKDWDHGPMGAKFDDSTGKLLVKEIEVGSPAWEAGLLKGDEIVFLTRRGNEKLYGLPGTYGITLPEKKKTVITSQLGDTRTALGALASPISGVQYYFGWKRPGQADVIEGLTTVRRRPLWRFFPGFDANDRFEHWVAWIWKTGHYATSTNGDFLVGWQLNDPDTITRKKPQFFLANRFKAVLNKKVPVLRLMQKRDLSATLAELYGPNPQTPKFNKYEPAPVRMTPSANAVGPKGLTVKIDVAARGTNPDLLPERVEIWVNDHRVKRWDAGGKPVAANEVIPLDDFRNGENEVTVLTFNALGGRGEARETVTASRTADKPQLLGMMVGINNYTAPDTLPDGSREFGPLQYANNDAEKLVEQFKTHAGENRLYKSAPLGMALDAKANQKDLMAQLKKVAKEAKPDDLVVIFLAGHGDFVAKPGAPKGTDDKEFVFCCPDYSRNQIGDTGVTATMIFETLAECKGRKLILFDACHSGQAASENVIRHLVPDGQGPMVIAACDQKEQSYEHPKLGHGLFTAAVLEALGDKFPVADGAHGDKPDGILDVQELFDYVRGRLPVLLKEIGRRERTQNPQAFPADLARFPIARK